MIDTTDIPEAGEDFFKRAKLILPKLTTAQVRALAAVRDGLVTHKFGPTGNVFVGPKSIGNVLYRKLQKARLIEDAPRPFGTGVTASYYKQQLTAAGRAALAANPSSAARPTRGHPKVMKALASLCIVAAVSVVSAAHAQDSRQDGTRSFYDRSGSFAGSSSTHGNSTSFTDRNGRFDGTAIRNSNGTTSVYDRNGHFTGSSVNTTQPR